MQVPAVLVAVINTLYLVPFPVANPGFPVGGGAWTSDVGAFR